MDFSIEGDNIRFGLTSIKGISDKSLKNLRISKTDILQSLRSFKGRAKQGLAWGFYLR